MKNENIFLVYAGAGGGSWRSLVPKLNEDSDRPSITRTYNFTEESSIN